MEKTLDFFYKVGYNERKQSETKSNKTKQSETKKEEKEP